MSASVIAAALMGDPAALDRFSPERRAALVRTAERLASVPAAVAPSIEKVDSEAQVLMILDAAYKAALIELFPITVH